MTKMINMMIHIWIKIWKKYQNLHKCWSNPCSSFSKLDRIIDQRWARWPKWWSSLWSSLLKTGSQSGSWRNDGPLYDPVYVKLDHKVDHPVLNLATVVLNLATVMLNLATVLKSVLKLSTDLSTVAKFLVAKNSHGWDSMWLLLLSAFSILLRLS